MIVFKFGGASVKSADAVKNVVSIMKRYRASEVVVVISAMGKMTNALEELIEAHATGGIEKQREALSRIRTFHLSIVEELFPARHEVFAQVEGWFAGMEDRLSQVPSGDYDFEYDQLIGYGELLSTTIVAAYLNHAGLPARWLDVRQSLKTDDTWREGRIDWEHSSRLVQENFLFGEEKILVTQGFLASTPDGRTTSLGREGSDYTAAILAHILKADDVTIWKDVPGVLNADPKYFDDTVLLEQLSYLDATELAYFGTSVIHPKTIKPLQNKNINLHVKSFLDPDAPGTVVGNQRYDTLTPSFIFRMDQVLIRVSPLDFSFINENNLEKIFGVLHKHGLKINMMQNSALSFKMIVNHDRRKLLGVVDDLEKDFKVSYQTGLELVTIRYFDQSTIDRVMINKELILEQRGVQNIELLIRDLG